MTNLDSAQLRYLKEVLGVEQILWRAPYKATAEDLIARPAAEAPVLVFVEKLSPDEKVLLQKMLQAMKLSTADYSIIEAPTEQKFDQGLKTKPTLALIFGQNLAGQLNLDFEKRGRFIDCQGVATIVTYGPQELLVHSELKAEAWKDMRTAMNRLK